jgi:hypothetical protein
MTAVLTTEWRCSGCDRIQPSEGHASDCTTVKR